MTAGDTQEFEFAQLVAKENANMALLRVLLALVGVGVISAIAYRFATGTVGGLTEGLTLALGATLLGLSTAAVAFRFSPNAISVWIEPEGFRVNYERGRSRFVAWVGRNGPITLDDWSQVGFGGGMPEAAHLLWFSRLQRTRISPGAHEAIKRSAAVHGWDISETKIRFGAVRTVLRPRA